MPQMSPLPWVLLWMEVLSLVMAFMVLVFFLNCSSMKMNSFISSDNKFGWMW